MDKTISLRLKSINSSKAKEKIDIFNLPPVNTFHGKFKLSYFLPNFVNKTLRNSFNLSFIDFRNFLKNNLLLLFTEFNNYFFN